MGRTILLILMLLATILVLAACGGATASPTAPAGAAAPVYPVAGTPPAAYPASPTQAPASEVYPVAPDGKALVGERCTVCHDTARIQSAKKTAADWQSTVARMKGKGAKLNDAETTVVTSYLSATFK